MVRQLFTACLLFPHDGEGHEATSLWPDGHTLVSGVYRLADTTPVRRYPFRDTRRLLLTGVVSINLHDA